MKPHLVICRVGSGSLHRAWLGDARTRSYDVWLDGIEDGLPFAGDDARFSVGLDTSKWPRVGALCAERPELSDYGAVFVPDDDLAMTDADIERLFEIRERLDLDLAQPALTSDSYYTYGFSLACRTFQVRYTNMVEVMAPLFSRDGWRLCAPSFARSFSGWGLDFVWPSLLGDVDGRVAVIDDVPIRHTRPVGSLAYFAKMGIDPMVEQAEVADVFDVPLPYQPRQLGGIPTGAPLSRESIRSRGLGYSLRVFAGAPLRRLLSWDFVVRQKRSLKAPRRA